MSARIASRLDWVFVCLIPVLLIGCVTLPWTDEFNKGSGKSDREVWDDNASLVRDCIERGGTAVYTEADGHVAEYLGCEESP